MLFLAHLPSKISHIEIIKWNEKSFATINRCTERLKEVSRKAGTTSKAFEDILNKFLKLALSGDIDGILRQTTRPIHVRAIAYLLLESEPFRNKVPICSKLVQAMEAPLGRLSTYVLLSVIHVWFKYFDLACPQSKLDNFGEYLANRIRQQTEKSTCPIELKHLNKYGQLIFKADGPRRLVESLSPSETLEQIFGHPGLKEHKTGRFHKICFIQHYLGTLETIPVGSNHSILNEIKKPDIYNIPYDDKFLFGHKILSTLIDRTPAGSGISDEWQNVILTIAGDPRVPKSSQRFMKWWTFMTSSQISKFLGWLSKYDLKLFLEALENYGQSSSNQELCRMFPTRKQFLEGLLKQGLVSKSRLFLGRYAELFLKSSYRSDELPSYAKLLDSKKSIIYLQVGNCHIIEGTHSFKMYIYSYLPENLPLFDYSHIYYSINELTNKIINKIHINYNEKKYVQIIHRPHNFYWQNIAIRFLTKNGVNIDIEKIFNNEEYINYLKLHGI
ncbi:MAG: hypothetical protein EOM12_04655 [Verrucomicrobiae bacterium]|nr:hypothetical protein [Verrucomicrobiae bacterium]